MLLLLILVFYLNLLCILRVCYACFSITFFLYSTLGGSHGVPQVYYKGKQGDYFIMVCYLVLFFSNLDLIVFNYYLKDNVIFL